MTEGDLPNFRLQPSSHFEPLWICIDLHNSEMMMYSPYSQYEAMNCESEDEPADPEQDDRQNFLILHAGQCIGI